MSEKVKTGNDHVSDFVRYHGNKMTDKERNAFEKNLQKDPFANEASEGFDLIDPFIAKMDLLTIGKRLRERSSGKQRIIWYRIAASVAVLMILSSIFIIVKKERPSAQISYSQAPPSYKKTPEKPEQEPPPGKMEKKEPAAIVPSIAKEVPAVTQKPEISSDKKIENRKENTITEQQADLIVAQAGQPEKAVTGGEKTLAEINEIVVVDYGTRSKDYVREDVLTDYIPPRPLNGEAEFDKYIKENIIRPDTATTGQRVVVVLSFIVGVNGKIDSIKIMRSPGKIFSDEAIRLIKEGPDWKPAEENGKVIDDEVRIRIVFK